MGPRRIDAVGSLVEGPVRRDTCWLAITISTFLLEEPAPSTTSFRMIPSRKISGDGDNEPFDIAMVYPLATTPGPVAVE